MIYQDFGQRMKGILGFLIVLWVGPVFFCGPVEAGDAREIHLVFYGDTGPVGVAVPLPGLLEKAGLSAAKPCYASQVKAVVQAIVQGPSQLQKAKGIRSLLPAGTQLVATEVKDATSITVRLAMGRQFLESEMNDVFADEIIRVFAYPIYDLGRPFQLTIVARPLEEPGAPFKQIPEYLPPPPPAKEKPDAAEAEATPPSLNEGRQTLGGQSPFRGQGQPTGALTGASIFVSPGHGWYYSTTLNRWATQRGNTNNIIEDLSNGEACLNWLVKYLWNAGARVYTVRERDLQTNMVIVDDGGAGFSTTGSWSSATLSGAYNGSLRRTTTVTGSPTATARFTPNIPQRGYYAVYVWYRTAGIGTTTSDARITIHHVGGSTVWMQNQNRDGYTWKYVGTYYFEAGSSPSTGSVVVDNQSSTAGHYVVADAVRFGGGMGDILDPDDPAPQTVSGKPRWEESGRYYRVFMGDNTWAGTVWAMPQYADWECEDGWEGNGGATPHNNAVYVSWHTNAPDPGTGTSSFAYTSSSSWNGPFTGVPGGLELRDSIHNELINDIRAGWDAGWSNRGTHTANFGEINPGNNDDMPASLHEIAFHDTPADAECLRDPRFRQLTARAFYQGIVNFFYSYYYLTEGNADFNDNTLLPEPPTHFRATLNGTGGIHLAWDAPPYNTGDNLLGDAATGYRVYRSTHPKGFADGVAVAGTSYTDTSGLVDGTVYYYRVAATNSGGESFPTETLAVRYQPGGTNPILIVSGFDRLDRFAMIVTGDPYSTNELHREYLDRMNSYDYVTFVAKDIEAYGEFFDSCSNETVENGDISLGSYAAVVWLLGEEAVSDETFSAAEQSVVQTYLSGGGNLFVSGAEIGWDLDRPSGPSSADRAFYNTYLRASYVADDVGTYSAAGAAGSIFEGLTLTFDNGSQIYNVDYPDVIAPAGGSTVAMYYASATGSSIDNFESIGGWRDPNYSGQTNADDASTFTIASSPTYEGFGSGDLYYVWETGNFIREYNSTQPQFPVSATFSIWVYGDNSGHEVRIALRDSDVEIYVNDYLTIDFTGWRQIVWPDVQNNPGTRWYDPGGDGVITGPNIAFDSIQVNKVSGVNSGHLYFDEASYSTGGGGTATAGVQYSGPYKLVHLGFPYEATTSGAVRAEVMEAVLDFFGFGSDVSHWERY